MNKEQIKDLIASKIAGQGSAVDAGNALPEILNGLVEIIENQQETITKQKELLDKYFFTGTLTNPLIEVSDSFVTELTDEEFRKLETALVLWGSPRINILPETFMAAVVDKAAKLNYDLFSANLCWGFLRDERGEVMGPAYYISSVSGKYYLVEMEIGL